MKVDAQFGGVDQRKIFTFAEKVRGEGFAWSFQTVLGPALKWLLRAFCPRHVDVDLGNTLCPIANTHTQTSHQIYICSVRSLVSVATSLLGVAPV